MTKKVNRFSIMIYCDLIWSLFHIVIATGWGLEGCGFKSRPSGQTLAPSCYKNTRTNDLQLDKKRLHDINLLDTAGFKLKLKRNEVLTKLFVYKVKSMCLFRRNNKNESMYRPFVKTSNLSVFIDLYFLFDVRYNDRLCVQQT